MFLVFAFNPQKTLTCLLPNIQQSRHLYGALVGPWELSIPVAIKKWTHCSARIKWTNTQDASERARAGSLDGR